MILIPRLFSFACYFASLASLFTHLVFCSPLLFFPSLFCYYIPILSIMPPPSKYHSILHYSVTFLPPTCRPSFKPSPTNSTYYYTNKMSHVCFYGLVIVQHATNYFDTLDSCSADCYWTHKSPMLNECSWISWLPCWVINHLNCKFIPSLKLDGANYHSCHFASG